MALREEYKSRDEQVSAPSKAPGLNQEPIAEIFLARATKPTQPQLLPIGQAKLAFRSQKYRVRCAR